MMQLLRRELLIDLHTYSCALRWPERTGMLTRQRRSQPLATGAGRGARALETALANLGLVSERAQNAHRLKLAGRLTIADEYVDYTVVPGNRLRWHTVDEAAARARHHFADLVGHDDSVVACTALPGTHDWLCAAIDPDELSTWRERLAAHGVRLRHVHPALVEDLCTLGPQLKEPECVLALPREEGLMLIHLADGVLQSLQWVPLNPQETAIVDLRLRHFIRQTLKHDPWRTNTVVYVRSVSGALSRYTMDLEASTFWSDQSAA